jgi:hypothetical protein
MRKLILISALLLASASAQAGESRGLVLAATTDTPAMTTADALPQPLPPVAKTDAKTETKTEARSDARADARTDAPRQQANEPSAPALRAAKARAQQARRYGSDEAKARRIAAKYGISW